MDDDPELEEIKARALELEQEIEEIRLLEEDVDKYLSLTSVKQMNADLRSVYLGNLNYSAMEEDIMEHFQDCGNINRITIMCNKFNGHPKGFGYIEFEDMESMQLALAMNGTLLKGRQIKVSPKRTNKPGAGKINGTPRGRGGFKRGRGHKFFNKYKIY